MTSGPGPDHPLESAEQSGYERAIRWASIRQRQAAHDGAVVVEAYFLGYLAGMRDEVADTVASEYGDLGQGDEGDGAEHDASSEVAIPSLANVVKRARMEGYADGRYWREPAKLGGIVRLAAYHSAKSGRRFAAEDLMRTPRRVRRMRKYEEDVEESVSTELLRRLYAIRAPASDTGA